MKLLYFSISFAWICILPVCGQTSKDFLAWRQGYLDIHHINTARGNATFFVFPDGTTMLFDAGAKQIPPEKTSEYFSALPNDSLSPGGWIAHYIKKVTAGDETSSVDYAVISHFHNDHYGEVHPSSKKSAKFNYRLTGITEVGDRVTIKTLIDRGFPDYDFPLDLKQFYKLDTTFMNYVAFVNEQTSKNGLKVESLMAGRNDQIILKKDAGMYPTFSVRNVKTNSIIWSGKGTETFTVTFDSPLVHENDLDENALGLALKISYGAFDYFTGGDLNGYLKWGGSDMETPVAKSVGKVEALALNHHGYYDGTNTFFLKTLSPSVAIHQAIHDPHFQPSVLKRLSRHPIHLFTYNMHQSVRESLSSKIRNLYKSSDGHIVLRVIPGGDRYDVYILDDRDSQLRVLSHFGPYKSHQ